MERSPIAQQVVTHLSLPQERWSRPVLIGIFGLPCTGKTEIASSLSGRYPLIVLSTDAIRLHYQLASGPASHAIIVDVVDYLLPRRYGVVVDGIHLGRSDRDQIRRIARVHNARCWIIYATAAPSVIAQRLQARRSRPMHTTVEGKFVIAPDQFDRIAGYLEAPQVDEVIATVDTSHDDLQGQLAELERQLEAMIRGP